jgi:serine/threonine-protein kinase
MGTPAYMASEQWSDSSQVDWRADVHSLGCVIFEMACGRPPFVAATIPEAYTKHAHAKPPDPRTLDEAIPADLAELVLRLLAKDPADRCVSMGQVTRELEAIAQGKDPSTVARESRPLRAESPRPVVIATPSMTTISASAAELEITRARKRPALIGGIVAGVLVLGAVAVIATRGHDEPKHPEEPAAAPPRPVAIDAAAAPVAVDAQVAVDAAPVVIDAPVIVDAPAPPPPKPPTHMIHKPPVPPPPARPDAGVAKPPPDPNDLGGRL